MIGNKKHFWMTLSCSDLDGLCYVIEIAESRGFEALTETLTRENGLWVMLAKSDCPLDAIHEDRLMKRKQALSKEDSLFVGRV